MITPWNAPLMLATWRIAPALAAGNTVVAKPPEWAPLTASLLADITRAAGVDVAILYPRWFKLYGGLPADWTEVGQWRISRNVVCGADSVSIYAVSPAAIAPLTRQLREFDAVLPATVARSGPYTKTGAVAALR